LIVYTSGTTGKPKALSLSSRHHPFVPAFLDNVGLTQDDVIGVVTP